MGARERQTGKGENEQAGREGEKGGREGKKAMKRGNMGWGKEKGREGRGRRVSG